MAQSSPEEIALHWHSAASSGFAAPGDWKAWADRLIEVTDEPPMWLIDISLAGSTEALLPIMGALRRKVHEPMCVGILHHAEQADALQNGLDDVEAGYYLLKLEEGRLNLRDTLIAIGDFTDAADGISAGQCEDFYDLCNRLDSGESEAEIKRLLYQRIGKLGEIARSQWVELQALRSLGSHPGT